MQPQSACYTGNCSMSGLKRQPQCCFEKVITLWLFYVLLLIIIYFNDTDIKVASLVRSLRRQLVSLINSLMFFSPQEISAKNKGIKSFLYYHLTMNMTLYNLTWGFLISCVFSCRLGVSKVKWCGPYRAVESFSLCVLLHLPSFPCLCFIFHFIFICTFLVGASVRHTGIFLTL